MSRRISAQKSVRNSKHWLQKKIMICIVIGTPPKGPDSFVLTYKKLKRNRLGYEVHGPLQEILDPPLIVIFLD